MRCWIEVTVFCTDDRRIKRWLVMKEPPREVMNVVHHHLHRSNMTLSKTLCNDFKPIVKLGPYLNEHEAQVALGTVQHIFDEMHHNGIEHNWLMEGF